MQIGFLVILLKYLHIVSGGWDIGNLDQNLQSLLLAFLWWTVIIFDTYVGMFFKEATKSIFSFSINI